MRNVILLLLTLVSACQFAPTYRTPTAPIPSSYSQLDETSASSTLPPLAQPFGWQEYFADERLRALIAQALESNRDLAQSVAQIAQAHARARIATAQRLPVPSLNAEAARSGQPLSAVEASQGLPLSSGSGAGAVDSTQYNMGVGLSQFEIDLWGRLQSLAAADRARYLGSIEGARAVRLGLIAEVARTFFDIRAGEERIALADRSIVGRREGVRIARMRLDAGVTSTIDSDQASLLLTQAQAELAEVKRVTEQSRHLLDVLTGGPIARPLPSGNPLALTQQLRPIEPGLPSALLTRRPDIAEAEYQLKAANANIGALRAQFFPSISLTAAYGFTSSVLSTLISGSSRSWSVGGGANLPIFDWERRRAQLDEGNAHADELIAAYQRTVQGAFREVADALTARHRYAEQIDAQTMTVNVQRAIAHAARLRYDNGISIYLEVLDAERGLFSAEQQLVQLQVLELQNAVSLYTALGGGSGDRSVSFDRPISDAAGG